MAGAGASTPEEAWASFVDGLREAGDQLAEQVSGLDPTQQALAYRSLLRGLNNQLGRFEVDRDRPELVFFNGWREKMFMDNPDFRYWVADVRGGGRYRITGSIGDAAYLSVTAYSASGTLEASATSRIDSDSIAFDDAGHFELTVSPEDPGDGADHLPLPDDARVVWVRQFHHDARADQLGWCRIDPIDDPPLTPMVDPAAFGRHLNRLGRGMASFPAIWSASTRDDLASPNEVRHWNEMAGGAAFTEPGIHYLRGSWQLSEGEALVVEGIPPQSRYWNVLLYDRFLNSLDHRARTVSYTDGTTHLVDGRFRFVISATDPGTGFDHLDTGGLPFGLFVFRFLQPITTPDLPTVTRCRVDDLTNGA